MNHVTILGKSLVFTLQKKIRFSFFRNCTKLADCDELASPSPPSLQIYGCHLKTTYSVELKLSDFSSLSVKLQLHDAIYRLRFCSHWLIHILSLSNSHNNVASIQKNPGDKSHRVIEALVSHLLQEVT